MMARTHSNSQAVEQGAHIEMMDVTHQKRDHCILGLGRAKDANLRYGRHAFHTITGELLFVSSNVVHPQALQILDGGGQAVGGHIVGCAGLELERQMTERSLLESDSLYHLASTLIGRHTVEQVGFSVEYANARGAIHLVAAENKEIAIHGLHVHLEMRRALRPVHHHGYAMGMRHLHDTLHGVYRAQDITHMGYTHKPRPRIEQPFQLVQLKFSLIRHGHHTQHDALATGL